MLSVEKKTEVIKKVKEQKYQEKSKENFETKICPNATVFREVEEATAKSLFFFIKWNIFVSKNLHSAFWEISKYGPECSTTYLCTTWV